MKLEVWTKPDRKEEEPTRVRLRKEADGTLVLEAVDIHGDRLHAGTLGYFAALGEGFHRISGVNSSLGFRLDDKGRLLII